LLSGRLALIVPGVGIALRASYINETTNMIGQLNMNSLLLPAPFLDKERRREVSRIK